MPEAFEIRMLPEFLQAVEHEFWARYPDLYERYCVFLGTQIQRVQRGEIKERDYIEEWKDKHPGKEEP